MSSYNISGRYATLLQRHGGAFLFHQNHCVMVEFSHDHAVDVRGFFCMYFYPCGVVYIGCPE